MNRLKWKWNIPNALSLLRLALIPAIAVTYLKSEQEGAMLWIAVGLLALSGLTDLFDGIIARKCNQITDVGKLLDPLADKLTQVTVLVCLTVRYPHLLPLAILCVVKEGCQALGGWLMLRRGEKVHGARWFGKVSTFLFYGAMAAIVAFPEMPRAVFYVLIALVAAAMLFAFANYLKMYVYIRNHPQIEQEDSHTEIA